MSTTTTPHELAADSIFVAAEYWAKQRAYWIGRANDADRSAQSLAEFPRRRCLHLARKAEARVVNLSIGAEIHCRLELDVQEVCQ